MAMHDLHVFAADESRGAQYELEWVRLRSGIEERRAKFRNDGRKRTSGGTGNGDLLAEAMQFGGQFHALIVGAAAGEEGIQMHDAQPLGNRIHADGAPGQVLFDAAFAANFF